MSNIFLWGSGLGMVPFLSTLALVWVSNRVNLGSRAAVLESQSSLCYRMRPCPFF